MAVFFQTPIHHYPYWHTHHSDEFTGCLATSLFIYIIASSVFHPTLTTSSIRMQSTASVHEATVNPVSSSASLPYNIGSATSIYESVSIEPVVSALMTNSPLSVVLKSSYFSSEEELRTTIVTLSQTIPSHNRNSNIAQSVTTSSSTGQSIDVLVPSKTVQAQAGTNNY